ncbi:zf-TFIIB domain-containing protein [Modestobacter excelsi]|uniref:TFIIB-type zinc ribbon-containing protein n=1 Tax=Modestobacter excelsi TaxID=2213161 RepID=UPI00110CEAB2|nr:zf-TFIIB domain-containing protein [Modestobacter excelsi]
MDLVCPKCQGTMRTYERNGVHVDQCTECRGIFLDRGELERLVDAENAWHGGPAAQPAPQQSTLQPSHQQPGLQQPAASLGSVVSEVLGQVRSSSSSSHGHQQRPKKQKSLISELFG